MINRAGGMLLDHELSTPWRETKFEQAAEFGGALKGLFLHTELIQPRRAGGGGDARTPDPAFSPAQYERLALLYTSPACAPIDGSFRRFTRRSMPTSSTVMTIR